MDAHTLHIANGTDTTRLIELAGIAGDRSIYADAFHDGPVPDGLSDEALREVRARHFAPLIGDDDWRGVFAEVTRWDAAVRNIGAYREAVLWFEHDLFDQLNLIYLLDRLDSLRHATPTRISLICIGTFPGHEDFKGLGELSPAEISTLPETRQLVTEEQFELAGQAWRAFRSPDPHALEELLARGTNALPFLGNALRRHLEEFPDSVTGLSRTEHGVLEIALTPTTALHAFSRIHNGEDAFFIADLSFWGVVRTLSAGRPALLELSDLPAAGLDVARSMATTRIQTTNVGREVVERRQDRIATTGIDVWRGGVHLVGRHAIWRWDRSSRHLVRS